MENKLRKIEINLSGLPNVEVVLAPKAYVLDFDLDWRKPPFGIIHSLEKEGSKLHAFVETVQSLPLEDKCYSTSNFGYRTIDTGAITKIFLQCISIGFNPKYKAHAKA